MIGRQLGHYRIVEPIGRGGMGEVYRARDGRLHRDVAIKLLPPEDVADAVSRRRFRREALALSQLNHPNIATVHDFDHQDGADFLVMELVPGESLAQRLARGPLPEDEVRRLGAELARGLAAAHERGVLHRDLKPANLQVTPDGRLKILDFGLARLLESPQGASLTTQTDALAGAGTLPYMAPEQLAGREADARTDLYGAGAVLYEATTGRLPFVANTSAQLVYSILNESPAPPSKIRSEISPGLDAVILRALDKDPAQRQASAAQLAKELETGVLGQPPPARRSLFHWTGKRRWVHALALGAIITVIAFSALCMRQGFQPGKASASLAVLPFTNLSGDSKQDYFADGMTDELITELSKVASLRVISRTSTMRYKNTGKPLSQIARELRVGRLVEGTVLRAGDRVRISAKLLDASADRNLWTERYDRQISDVLALQSDVAQAIVSQVRVRVTPSERARLANKRTVDPRGYEAYLRGRYHLDHQELASYQEALASFRLAIRLDPRDAASWSGIADALYLMSSIYLSASEAMPRARDAAEHALAIDPQLGPAHASMGCVLSLYDRKWKEAEAEFRRAIELSPSHAPSHYYYSYVMALQGRFAEARVESKTARDLDPLSGFYSNFAAWIDLLSGNTSSAIASYQSVVALDSSDAQSHMSLAICYGEQKLMDQSIDEARTATRLADFPGAWSVLGNLCARAGRRAEALAILKRLETSTTFVQSTYPARVYIGLGMYDKAFASMYTGLERRDEDLLWIMVDPLFKPLRSDPRFQELAQRMGLAS